MTAPLIRKTGLNRADLVYCLGAPRAGTPDHMVALFGFEPKKTKPAEQPPPPTPQVEPVPEKEPAETAATTPQRLDFRHVTHFERREAEPSYEVPAWVTEAELLTHDQPDFDPATPLPKKPPLVPWSRLWPFLRRVLCDHRPSREIDYNRAVDALARGNPVKHLPRRQTRFWSPVCQIIIDRAFRLTPFHGDFRDLVEGLIALRGREGLQVLYLDHGPAGDVRDWLRSDLPPRPYAPPPPGSPILVLGDLGCLAGNPETRKAWRRFGRQISAFQPVVLMPCAPDSWDPVLTPFWRPVFWDRGRRLTLTSGRHGGGRDTGDDAGLSRLLRLLAPALRIEPGLLRAARFLLPQGRVTVNGEAMAWRHAHTAANPLACSIRPAWVPHYRAAFAKLDPRLQAAAANLIETWHQRLPPSTRAMETVVSRNLRGLPMADAYIARVVRTLMSRSGRTANLELWFDRMADRQHRQMWDDPGMVAAWALACLHRGREVPEGLDLLRAPWALQLGERETTWALVREGRRLRLLPTENAACPVLSFRTRAEMITHGDQHVSIPLSLEVGNAVALPEHPLIIKTERASFTLAPAEKPAWAQAMGRDQEGLFVRFTTDDEQRQAYWHPPQPIPVIVEGQKRELPPIEGCWMDAAMYRMVRGPGLTKPSWAVDFGLDEYGAFATFRIKKVTLRMRLILPGKFLMGSSKDEPERYNDELQHEVTLTRGFWLAETACTQTLWQAVMKKNPSDFRGSKRPVENVSWNDTQTFFKRVGAGRGESVLRLPTEAEWEYACRAGTRTPFWFGNQITPEQVNYDWNHGETVPVKALPANAWGLYQMLGNVYEWCQDEFGNYEPGPTVDPVSTATGERRVLRGGSWDVLGGIVRSAYRFSAGPGYRSDDIGFRPARGL
ncbi:MAG: formylglycine-generating enzyme family protein [Acidobacteriota bacterium]|nr:formylglycine-generating enzyme family protein [Acidobacteriota bacterium]